jgi:hypothetical protein
MCKKNIIYIGRLESLGFKGLYNWQDTWYGWEKRNAYKILAMKPIRKCKTRGILYVF